MSSFRSFEIDTTNPYLRQAAELREIFARDAVERDKLGGRPLAQLALLKESGLLSLIVAQRLGGAGQPWSTALRIVREFAKVDGSLGHLFGYHLGAQKAVVLSGSAEQADHLHRESVRHNWFWANNGNSFSKSLHGVNHGDHWVLNGHKPFTSGSHIADQLSITWLDEAGKTVAGSIPSSRAGWQAQNDWDAFGQRQTGSGTATYSNVLVEAAEVYRPVEHLDSAFRSLTAQFQHSVLLNVFLGTAQGALLAARDYSLHQSRPWVHAGVELHVDDPWVKRVYGDLYTKVEAATLLADRALGVLDTAWERGFALTAQQRGEAAVQIAAANAYAGNVALEATSKIFEVTGARSTTESLGLDRFWRNVRVHTLHNPEEYKTRNVGAWFLTGDIPVPASHQ